jgi:hypothetical protein
MWGVLEKQDWASLKISFVANRRQPHRADKRSTLQIFT